MKERLRKVVSSIIFILVMACVGVALGYFILFLIHLHVAKVSNMETKSETDKTQITENDESVQPEIVLEEELISEYTIINTSSSENRNTNMAVAAQIINGQSNGYVLQAGETFSWLDIVGATTVEKGFKLAPIQINGKARQGLGGGVCQVSSCINSAVVKLGVPTKAQKHYKKRPSYLSPEDAEATVSFDSGINFSFQNTLVYSIRVYVETEGGRVTVRIFSREVPK